MSNIFIGLKKTCLSILETGERDKNNETDLKVGRGIEMSTTVLPLRDARSLRLIYLPKCCIPCFNALLYVTSSCRSPLFNRNLERVKSRNVQFFC